MICFFIFLGVYYRCCIYEFLVFLYRYAVSWNGAFRKIIDKTNWDDNNYKEGRIGARLPE